MTVTDHPELVAALLALHGVAAAAVEPAHDGPGTLRLQLEPGADEVGVAGEVNRVLRGGFGLAVDADRVRVVEEPARTAGRGSGEAAREADPDPAASVGPAAPVGHAGVEPAAPVELGAAGYVDAVEHSPAERSEPSALPEVVVARPGRLVIERVELVSAGLGTFVSVCLGLDGRSYAGTGEGTATPGSLQRSVAGATLRAVEAVVDGAARFDVEHVEIATTGSDRTALVVVTMVTERATQRLSGASVVRDDVRQAVIRAVLAAVNRRVEAMVGEVPG